MNIDPTGEDWWQWGAAALLVTGLVALSVLTCGGAAAAVGTAMAIASGACTGVSTAATVATAAAMGASAAFAATAAYAASESQSLDEFASYGGAALANTAFGAAAGAAYGYYHAHTACFIAGTLVYAQAGQVPIEQIDAGEYVWAWDEETGDVALKQVVETYINETDELTHIHVCGEEIVCTPSHPFYSPVKGWTSACKLRAGDILQLVNGEYVVVEKVQHELLESPIKVYNFQVQDYHTYYVSSAGLLVHNSCGGETAATRRGREMHKTWDYGGPVQKEYSLPGVGRADAVDFVNRIVYELKPDNARAIKQGWIQLNNYASALESRFGGTWIRILETYK